MSRKRSKKSGKSEIIIEIKPSFLVVLIVTFVLLVALAVGLVVVMNGEFDRPSNGGSGGGKGGKDKTEQTTTGNNNKPSVPAGTNTTPLFPTNETRDSYNISTAADVVTLTDDSFIKSNNTILVKVGADSLVSVVEKNADAKMYPASMTKVMTLIVACERVTDLDKKLEVTAEIAKFAEDSDGSGAGLKVGESYTVKDLLYLISYKSDTIASLLIAEHIAGSEVAFVDLMNQKVRDLGLVGTHFANCTGLYHAENYSTCRDIATIMAYALDNEMAFGVLSSYTGYKMTVGGVDCTFYSGWYSGRARFADNPRLSTVTVKAAKTGYIDESGISLVSYAVGKDGSKYINVIVGKPKGSGLTESMSTSEVKLIYNTYAK